MPDEFNLRALIREVCDTSDAADPAVLAKEVGARITRRQEHDALEQALPILVHHEVSRSRSVIPSSPGGQSRTDDHPVNATGVPSRKVVGIREAWRRTLRERIALDTRGGNWKFLAECTSFDLDAAAQIREVHAARTAASAARFRDLAKRLAEHGVDTVGELPEPVLAETLTGAP